MPSMVRTLLPLACPTSTVHDLTARPSICTTQAPHWLVSQPTWVPVRFRWSRRRWTRRVRSSTSAETALPFTVNLTVDTLKPPDAFLIVPIRSTGAGLCNNDFCRGSHCDVVCVATVLPATPGDPPAMSAIALIATRGLPFRAEPDRAHQIRR